MGWGERERERERESSFGHTFSGDEILFCLEGGWWEGHKCNNSNGNIFP